MKAFAHLPNGKAPYEKLQQTFYSKNEGFHRLREVVESNDPKYAVYRFVPVGSCSCERAFSALKDILTKKRTYTFESARLWMYILINAVPLGFRIVRKRVLKYDWVNEGCNCGRGADLEIELPDNYVELLDLVHEKYDLVIESEE